MAPNPCLSDCRPPLVRRARAKHEGQKNVATQRADGTLFPFLIKKKLNAASIRPSSSLSLRLPSPALCAFGFVDGSLFGSTCTFPLVLFGL